MLASRSLVFVLFALTLSVMDATSATRSRSRGERAQRRERCWSSGSMSQRLEEIVAELMLPIRDLQRNFDVDLSLLEEYLTEVGLQQLNGMMENFAMMGMVVEKCTHIYAKKVDYYEQMVYAMVERMTSLGHREAPREHREEVATETPTGRTQRRRRRHSEAFRDFAPIELEPALRISRLMEEPSPPPTLPKTYIEFDRTPLQEWEDRLRDYDGDDLGAKEDYHVNWNMKGGMVVDDLDASAAISSKMVVSIMVAVEDEMRRLTPASQDSGVASPDSASELHGEPADDARDNPPEETVPGDQKRRKRRGANERGNACKRRKADLCARQARAAATLWRGVTACRLNGHMELSLMEAGELEAGQLKWHPILLARGLRTLALNYDLSSYKLNGFPNEDIQDKTGLTGFTVEEAERAQEKAELCRQRAPGETLGSDFSGGGDGSAGDDCGFHDMSGLPDSTPPSSQEPTAAESAKRTEEWGAFFADRLAESASRPPYEAEVYTPRVLQQLSHDEPQHFSHMARELPQYDVSRYFFTVLNMANQGKVEIIKTSPPLCVGDFDVIRL